MQRTKNLLLIVTLGLLTGDVVTGLLAPGLLAWYNTPGGSSQALCNCTELVRATTDSLLRAQVIGSLIGGVVFLVLGVLLGGRRMPVAAPVPPKV